MPHTLVITSSNDTSFSVPNNSENNWANLLVSGTLQPLINRVEYLYNLIPKYTFLGANVVSCSDGLNVGISNILSLTNPDLTTYANASASYPITNETTYINSTNIDDFIWAINSWYYIYAFSGFPASFTGHGPYNQFYYSLQSPAGGNLYFPGTKTDIFVGSMRSSSSLHSFQKFYRTGRETLLAEYNPSDWQIVVNDNTINDRAWHTSATLEIPDSATHVYFEAQLDVASAESTPLVTIKLAGSDHIPIRTLTFNGAIGAVSHTETQNIWIPIDPVTRTISYKYSSTTSGTTFVLTVYGWRE